MPVSCNTSTEKPEADMDIQENEKSKATTNSTSLSQNKMVRTDCSEQKIDKFLNTSSSSSLMMPKSTTENEVVR